MSDMIKSPGRILFVDDEDDFRSSQSQLLRLDYDYIVDEARNAEEALQKARSGIRYQVALIDQVLQGSMDGVDLMRALRTDQPQVDVILLTGYGRGPEPGALQAGAYRFLEKPVRLDVLHQMIELCIDAQQARSDRESVSREHALLQTLLDLGSTISRSLNQAEILQTTYQHLGRLMNVENLDFALFNRRTGMLEFVLGYNENIPETPHTHPFASTDYQPGVTDWVIRHRAPFLITDLIAEPPPVQAYFRGQGDYARSWLGVPLLVQERAIGAIVLQHAEPSRYDSTDQRILMAVANLVAQALYNAQLYHELETLNRITRRINGIQELPALLDAITEEVASLIDTRNLRIGLYREVRGEVDLLIRLEDGKKISPLTLPVSNGLVGHTILAAESVLICTLDERKTFLEKNKITPVGYPCHSWLSVPLKTEEKGIIGAIAVQDYERDHAFDEHDLDLLMRLANHLAVAIDKAQLWQRLQRSLNQRSILYKIMNYLSPKPTLDRDWSWWAFLCGVTAGYGLCFNRAMIFCWHPEEGHEHERGILSGWRGTGDLNDEAAAETWRRMKAMNIDSLEAFLTLPVSEFGHTPVQNVLQGLRIEVQNGSEDIFSRVVFQQIPAVADGRAHYPAAQQFIQTFNPIEYAVAPLRLGERLDGVLVVDNRFTRLPIDEESLNLLTSFVEVFMTALNNLDLRQALEWQIRKLQRHYEVVTALRAIPNRDDSLHLIVHALRELYQLDTCTFGLVNPNRELITFDARHQIGIDQRLDLPIEKIPAWLWQNLNEKEEPQIFPELADFPTLREILVHPELASFVILPVRDMDDNLRAVLTMGRYGPLTVQPQDHASLQSLADQAGLAIQNAELFERLELQLKAQRLLLEIGQRISGAVAEPGENVLQVIANSAQELTRADCVVVYPYFQEGRRYDLQNIASVGLWSKKNPEEFADKERTRRSMTDIVLRNELLIVDKILSGHDREQKVKIQISDGSFPERESIQSFIGIRLETQDERVGALFVNFRSEHYFTEDEILAIRTFATQAAIAIDKNRLVSRVRTLSESQLGALQGLQRAEQLVSLLEQPLAQVWDVILQTAVDVTQADRAWFFIVNDVSGELAPIACKNASAQVSERIDLALKNVAGITEWVAEHKRSVRVGDVLNHPKWKHRYIPFIDSTRSEMVIPILVGRQREIIGIIDVESDCKYAFSADAQDLVEALASAAAVAHQNAFLYRKNSDLYSQAKRRQKYLDALLHSSNAINASLNPSAVLDIILEQAVKLTEIEGEPAHFGTIMLTDGQSLRFNNIYPQKFSKSIIGNIGEGIPLPDGKLTPDGKRRTGITGRVALTRIPANVGDVETDPDYLPFSSQTRSELVVPLIKGDEVLGVLNIEHTKENAFDRADLDALRMLAEQAVIAIQNAETYSELEKKQREIETKQDELAATMAVAWTGVLGSTLAHDIQGDASAIRNSAVYLAHKLAHQPQDAAIVDNLDSIKNTSERILAQAMHFKLSPEELPDRIDLHQLLHERLEKWEKRYDREHVDWDLILDPEASAPFVRINRLALEKALNNVVDNAVKFMRSQTLHRLIIQTRLVNQKICIDIQDSGPGIDADTQKRLFKGPLSHLPGESGQGIGLLIAWLVMRAMNGEIRLANTGPQGTTFSLSLPLD